MWLEVRLLPHELWSIMVKSCIFQLLQLIVVIGHWSASRDWSKSLSRFGFQLNFVWLGSNEFRDLGATSVGCRVSSCDWDLLSTV